MKYWKNLMDGGMIAAETKPATRGLWVEATEQAYNVYRMRVSYAMANLAAAVEAKRRILRAE